MLTGGTPAVARRAAADCIRNLCGRTAVLSSPLMEGLHTRLARDADDAGILDVAYRPLDTPAGPVLVTATGVAGLVTATGGLVRAPSRARVGGPAPVPRGGGAPDRGRHKKGP